MSDDIEAVVVAIVLGTITWVVVTVFLVALLGAVPEPAMRGPLSGVLRTIWNSWLAVGALLGIADAALILGAIFRVFQGGGR
ncbi:hypothetical protein U3A55_10410 [Salarchaeum sp. III]|uniref:hypothetical protein n=1 Tax=Salarchaeum sp. III TaxID=3107927 RepID=UPI002ED9006A